MELHHPILSKLWDLGGRTKRKKYTIFNEAILNAGAYDDNVNTVDTKEVERVEENENYPYGICCY